ncbi:melanocyte-stimulating hormone receptor-like [Esox lucius]|uniref:melanocyte-stimulating hormone receptor-like n=1 Tax=Esox lucius TaxID=8010 RepID=UPI000576DA4D|nr:melanocyte-stimulating hormone receptor-like [Esox lucius]XP_019901272.1 melanocyte-stimulating hormone receptor-like [Esox lucius]
MGPTDCNTTALQNTLTQMDSHLYHLVKLISLCVSCALNTVLSIPLLVAIIRAPSLLSQTRFFILTHLLCCDNIQLTLLTAKAALLSWWEGMPVEHCLVFFAATQAFSMVDLLLSTALALDRCAAIKWPLKYDLVVYPRRRRSAMAAIWSLSALVSIVSLGISLGTIEVNASRPRCRTLVLAPCLSGSGALAFSLFLTVVSGVLIPICHLTTLACFLLLCWDTRGRGGLLRSRRALVTLGLQATQTLFYSVPLVLDSPLLPLWVHCDGLDIATTTAYNLGISLIPLVYGYRSRELQRRLLQAKPSAFVMLSKWKCSNTGKCLNQDGSNS